jgi:superfamily II DNA or RNA helicase
MYAKVLMMSSAHTKIGVTATQASNAKGKWAAEALLGPVLGRYKIQDAHEDGILAKPTIHIYKTPYIRSDRTLPEYIDKYNFGIVDNVSRNIKIVEIALKFMEKNKTTLITVTSVEHGQALEWLFREYDQEIKFIYGKSSPEEREEIKNGLKKGTIKCAVASVIFLEGIDIPTLDVVINAGGGVSQVQVVQRIGRALRKTKTKNKAILVDFLDEVSPTLERQSRKRIDIYKEHGWKIIYKK